VSPFSISGKEVAACARTQSRSALSKLVGDAVRAAIASRPNSSTSRGSSVARSASGGGGQERLVGVLRADDQLHISLWLANMCQHGGEVLR